MIDNRHIVNRLRAGFTDHNYAHQLMNEAADRIRGLRVRRRGIGVRVRRGSGPLRRRLSAWLLPPASSSPPPPTAPPSSNSTTTTPTDGTEHDATTPTSSSSPSPTPSKPAPSSSTSPPPEFLRDAAHATDMFGEPPPAGRWTAEPGRIHTYPEPVLSAELGTIYRHGDLAFELIEIRGDGENLALGYRLVT